MRPWLLLLLVILVPAVIVLLLVVAAIKPGTVTPSPKPAKPATVHAASVFDPPPALPTTSSTTTVSSTSTSMPRPHETAPSKRSASVHPCGPAYSLPPCSVMMRESGGDINAYNPHGCGGRGCYGKWQCDPRSCSGRGTEAQQDDEARALWDGGRGCQHWDACAA